MKGDDAAETAIPLTAAQAGVPLKLVAVEGGRGLVQRLASMGLVRGSSLTLLRADRRGPVMLDVRGTRIAVGRGMAARIHVVAGTTV
jgi:ferrous iron transport protein A